MQFGFSEVCLDHDTGDRHPESADRLHAIKERLEHCHGVTYSDPDPAGRASVATVHEEAYLDDFEAFCANGGGNWDPDTVAGERTWEAALTSAGIAQWAARSAIGGTGGKHTPFGLGRPPGHHAVTDDAMGFCFFNNIAVAAQTVIDDGLVDRVAILDWDVHHGNGTQNIFYDRNDVFYVSIHEDGLYPGTGAADEIGDGPGRGTTLNAPLSTGAGDSDFLHVVESVVTPVLDRFDPGLVIVSAGFDAHRHDPISRLRLSSEGFGLLTDRVRSLGDACDADLGFVLEGGYGLDTLSEGVAMVHETFAGRDPVDPDGVPDDDTTELVEELRDRFDLHEWH